MGLNTKIDWCDHTWNPWQGCRKVSGGCANCYMYRDKKRYGQDPTTVVRSKPATFNAPLKWKKPARVFVCSWSDFFIEDADEWRADAWDIMRATPHMTYLILTKRPKNMADRLPSDWPMKNVWLGVTAENQEMLEKRLPILLNTRAEKRFLSVEPMLERVNIDTAWEHNWNEDRIKRLGDGHLDWVICGGESGPNARFLSSCWALGLKHQCQAAGVAFFMKQMSRGRQIPDYLNIKEFPG